MSRQHRHNSNTLRRAILAQAGPEAYPYQKYSPVSYDASYTAYSGPSNYGVWTDILAPLFTAAGGLTSNLVTANQQKKAAEAQLEYQERIAMEQIAAEERSRAAEALAYADSKTGGRGMTIGLSVLVLGLLGGGTYYVFRKRKKARK